MSSHDTNDGTKIGSMGPVSMSQSQGVQEPTYALTGLTRRHVEALRDMLSVARPVNSAQIEVIVLTLPVLDKI